ncbi:KTSC domain-containing protein [Acinetobacter wanghuae]|uniref:KTSC domain-containing protein n=1 Tax=Acinetobacter wanghuae TaxID=2662362 RepID=A0A5Q0P3D9_9GAMM|nr:KTSC domain-containing protein [Acinetobacter wanghuae]MQW91132.1 KTSC domain-containing protein [Acinetobacter wanghuae]QGA11314.1 KTSC domain-containing protein [Acinetobacter wanghuae]
MNIGLTVVSYKYNASSHHLHIYYNTGLIELYHPVPEYIYNNLLRREDKTAFVQKYLQYDLNFNKVYSN